MNRSGSTRNFGTGQAATPSRRLQALMMCLLALLTTSCDVEKRRVGPGVATTPPTGAHDRRQTLYETNLFEIAEGGRAFRWAGCDACHSVDATGVATLNDDAWTHGQAVAQIYVTIADGAPGMPGYAARLTPQQLWQVSGSVKTLHRLKDDVRRRAAAATRGEPSGATWQGALR